jgi:hypothetical protein
MSDDIRPSLPPRGSAAAGARVPVVEQVTRPVCTVSIGFGKAGPVTVLGDRLAVFADESGKPAEGDPLLRIDPDRTQVDPFRCGEVRLHGQPSIELGLVEEQLTASAGVAASCREDPGRFREAVAVTPVLPDVVGASSLLRSPDAQRGHAGWDLIVRPSRGHQTMIVQWRGVALSAPAPLGSCGTQDGQRAPPAVTQDRRPSASRGQTVHSPGTLACPGAAC